MKEDDIKDKNMENLEEKSNKEWIIEKEEEKKNIEKEIKNEVNMEIKNNNHNNKENNNLVQEQVEQNISQNNQGKEELKQQKENSKKINKENTNKISENFKKKNIVLSSQKEENQRRQHYVFNSKGNKIPEDSKSNEISSIQNCKTLNKPNYKFYYSFGTSKPPSMNQELNINKEKKIINVPRGIASTKTMSQKTQSYIASSRTETEKSKTINIFKPVPKIIIQTLKYNHKYQKNKQENSNKNNHININYRQNNNNISYKRKSDINKNKQLIYYARCPHCNYILNDEEEVKKYYNNLNNNKNNIKFSYDIKNEINYKNNTRCNKFSFKTENKKDKLSPIIRISLIKI